MLKVTWSECSNRELAAFLTGADTSSQVGDTERPLWGNYFCRKFVTGGLDFGNGYFDNDNVQTLFFEGILMDIMVDTGEM